MQVADDDILADGEVGEEVEFLIDDADAEALRIGGVAMETGCPSMRIAAVSGRVDPARIRASVLLPAPFSPMSA